MRIFFECPDVQHFCFLLEELHDTFRDMIKVLELLGGLHKILWLFPFVGDLQNFQIALKALDRHHVIYEAEFKLSHFEVNCLAIDAPRSLNHPLNVLYVSLDHIVSKLFPACHQIVCLGNETPQI
jgi:hypothetical protein